jgi:hypothetical protein
MNAHRAAWSTALACGLALVACRDTGTAPRSAAGAPVFSTAQDTGGGGGNQFHFVSNGVSGSANWSGGGDSTGSGGFSFGSLSVSRGGTTNNPQTFLFYFVEQCDAFFNCSVAGGSGLIPNGDLTGGLSGSQLHLRTNTTGNATFSTFEGPTGFIVADWKANGVITGSSTTILQEKFSSFTFKQQGSSSFATANVSGTVIGNPISFTTDASIGTNHNVTIDIVH